MSGAKENQLKNVKGQEKSNIGIKSNKFAGMSDKNTDYEVKDLEPYLPADLIGGSLPHVLGVEDEAVWNAAAQACGTEKVHYCYSIDEGRIWYLACPSSSLASNPDSWCPLAAALPGGSEHWDKETVYIYEQEGLASALRWDSETGRMQVFLGASRTILPRVQSMDANFVTINSKVADIKPWHSRTLHTEKLSRNMVRVLFYSGLIVSLVSVLLLISSLISMRFVESDLDAVKAQTDKAALELMEKAARVMQSDTIKHMVRIQQLLDNLAKSDGYLVRYEVLGGRTEWEAIVPRALSIQAQKDTTFRAIVGGRLIVNAPVIVKEDNGNVRLKGKK